MRFADDPEVRHRIVFLPNYDIAMAQPLYPGCDVWLNNPLRPYEACGTSGMKAALNGGLNLSILDGWWDEWYDGNNGWAIPSADGVDDADRRDDLEADALYDLIENEVAPRFYDVDEEGVPTRWIEMVRHTLKSLGPKVLATRMVRDYVRELYAPAAAHARACSTPTTPAPRELAAWKTRRARRLAVGARRARRVRGRRRRRRGRRRPSPYAPSSRWATSAPTTSRCRSCTAGPAADDELIDASVTVDARRPRPTTATGTASTPTSRSTTPARSATPSGSCRATTRSRRCRRWVWSRYPPRRRPTCAACGRAPFAAPPRSAR